MDLLSLHYFIEASKDLNFTQTAKRLFISQQTLSNHIARLERQYNTVLFERKPNLKLTYAGEAFLEFAQKEILEEDNFKLKLVEIRNEEHGKLDIGCSPNRTSLIISGVLEQFFKRYPHVQVNLHHHHSSLLAEMVLSGQLDFSVSVPQDDHPTLKVDPLFEDSTLLLVKDSLLRSYYPENYKDIIKSWSDGVVVEDFAHLPLLTIRDSKLVERIFQRSHLTPNLIVSSNFPQIFLDHFEDYAASVISNGNYQFIKNRFGSTVHTFPILVEQTPIKHTIAVIRNKRKFLPQYGKYFLTLTRDLFSKMGKTAG